MRISRLELKNFRTFAHLVLEDLPSIALFVSPNGRGKSSILEAIAGAHDLVTPYHAENYQFHEIWQRRQVEVWPPHLSPPVKIGEVHAEVIIEIQAARSEVEYLKLNPSATTGKAHFIIEDANRVVSRQADEIVKRLFQFHSPSAGVGFVDYIRPVRFYLPRKLGDFSSAMSDATTKQVFSEFHHPYNQHDKFASFKSYVVSSQLNDFSHFQATGQQRDSLSLFRKIFNHFFSPKQFVGYQNSSGGGEARIVVESPFGNHDTDCLSDGEKEILHTFAHLYRFRDLSNIVLWDTPESHLNAALESRLYHAIESIAPSNQFLIATHSLEFIDSVPLDNIFVIVQEGNSAKIERASGQNRKTRVAIYQDLGARIGLQLASSVVAFVEGKEAHSDKRILDRLIAPAVPNVNFVAGGSCDNILSVGTRANHLLAGACINGDFLAVVDRDYRSEEQTNDIESKYFGRLFMWHVHEIENLFLEPRLIAQTLTYLDKLNGCDNPELIESNLLKIAQELREWIAADWSAWEFHMSYKLPPRRIAANNPKDSLHEYASTLVDRIKNAIHPAAIEEKFDSKVSAVDQLIESGAWVTRLPGKQILSHFLNGYALDRDVFIRTATSTILEKQIVVPELERLKSTLNQMVAQVGPQGQ